MSTPSWVNLLNDAILKHDLTDANGTINETTIALLFTDLAAELTSTNKILSASQLHDLQTIAINLNVGETVTPYVTYIADALILGNTANTVWTGGSASTSALGNLTIGDTATHISELDGKWFLGTDLPSKSVYMGGSTFTVTYSLVSATFHPVLFGTSGVPSMNDINQGYLGDCYLLASLAEVANQNPATIQSMITDNGNYTYGVRLFVKGVAQYVTVNNVLPNSGKIFNDAYSTSNPYILWASLVEKAYAQIQANGIITGNPSYNYGNSFSSIGNGGYTKYTLEEITGATTITDFVGNGSSWKTVTYNQSLTQTSSASGLSTSSLYTTLCSYLDHGNDLILSSYSNARDSSGKTTLVANHAMSIYDYDSTTGLLWIRNPWGTAASGQYWDTTFEVSLTTLLAAHDTITVDNLTSTSASAAAGMQSSGISFTIADTGANVMSNFTALISDTKLTSITLTDTTPLSVTATQSVTGNALLSKILGTCNLSITGVTDGDTLHDTSNSLATMTGGTGTHTFMVAGNDWITDLNGGDILQVAAGGTANATVTAAWTATSATSNLGTANISTSGYGVNLSAVTTGNGFTITNTGSGTTLTGSSGNDTLISVAGNDTLMGGPGNDTLIVGTGTDTLTGGTGADIFRFNVIPTSKDTIIDFVHNQDILQFSKAIYTGITTAAGTGTGTTLAAKEFVSSSSAISGTTSTSHFIYNTTTWTLYYDADGNGPVAPVAIVGLTSHPALTAADIHVIA